MALIFTSSMAIRVVSVVSAVALVVLLPFNIALPVFFALGHAHFLLAFWYQREAGKLPNTKAILYLALLVGIVYVSGMLSFTTFLYVVALTFAFHMIRDELYLTRGTTSLFSTLETLPFLFLYAALLADILFNTTLLIPALILTGVVALAYGVLSITRKHVPDRTSYIHFFWAIVALLGYAFHLTVGGVSPGVWFLGLTVMHYLIWYAEYWNKLAAKPEKRLTYGWRVIIANVLFGVLAILWATGAVPILGVFFMPVMFYAWALLHILTSIRPADYANIFRLS